VEPIKSGIRLEVNEPIAVAEVASSAQPCQRLLFFTQTGVDHGNLI
jgi:hypothetical protein